MTKVLKQRLLVRVLCLLLSLFLLVMPILVPAAEAVFFESAAVAYAYELLAAALVAGGIVVANSDDLISVSAAVYKWAKDKADPLCDTLLGIARQALSFAGDITTTAWRMSMQAWDAICDALGSLGFDPAVSGTQSLGVWTDYTFTVPATPEPNSSVPWYPLIAAFNAVMPKQILVNGQKYELVLPDYNTQGSYKILINGQVVKESVIIDPLFKKQEYVRNGGFTMTYSQDGTVFLSFKPLVEGASSPTTNYVSNYTVYDLRFDKLPADITLSYPGGDVVDISGTLTYPGTMTKAPPLPTTTADPDTGKEIVVVPPISVKPGDWTADIPKTDTGDLVDVPTDTLVDATTGERVDVDNPDIPINPDIPDWPSTGDLSIPALIVSKFPFCIPFDVARLIGVLQADPVAPVFKFPLKYGTILNEEIVLDLSSWSDVVQVIRWGELIAFVAGLIYVTRNYIKW